MGEELADLSSGEVEQFSDLVVGLAVGFHLRDRRALLGTQVGDVSSGSRA
ncbi:hypothetical protein [Nocardia salmonicida]